MLVEPRLSTKENKLFSPKYFIGCILLTAVFTSLSKLAFCNLNARLLSSIFVSRMKIKLIAESSWEGSEE